VKTMVRSIWLTVHLGGRNKGVGLKNHSILDHLDHLSWICSWFGQFGPCGWCPDLSPAMFGRGLPNKYVSTEFHRSDRTKLSKNAAHQEDV
jgi:hypothetical protein